MLVMPEPDKSRITGKGLVEFVVCLIKERIPDDDRKVEYTVSGTHDDEIKLVVSYEDNNGGKYNLYLNIEKV